MLAGLTNAQVKKGKVSSPTVRIAIESDIEPIKSVTHNKSQILNTHLNIFLITLAFASNSWIGALDEFPSQRLRMSLA